MCLDALFPLFEPYLFLPDSSCLSVYSYIKPQQGSGGSKRSYRCLSVYSYIKPQRCGIECLGPCRCLSVYSYIKPQPLASACNLYFVVYLSIPTSNHNFLGNVNNRLSVVYLSIPTSNHNFGTLTL